jgi:hypothetical protein
MKFDIQDLNKHVAGSDTDSLIISLEDILKHRMENFSSAPDELILEEVKKLQKSMGDKLNEYQTTIATKCFNSSDHYLDLKPEYIIKKTYWAGKRRYAQYIIDKEGIPVEELDIKGLDIMKSNFPPLFRNFGEKLIKDILFGKSKSDIDKDVMEFKNSLHTIDWINLMKPTGLKKMNEYVERKAMPGELFSKLKLKCPVNTKSALAYNDILRFKNLTKKYPEFTIGDKMYIAMLKPNPYHITVIGYNGYNDPPDITKIIDEYIDREGIFDSVMRNKLQTVYNDLGWTLNLNENISKFFNF